MPTGTEFSHASRRHAIMPRERRSDHVSQLFGPLRARNNDSKNTRSMEEVPSSLLLLLSGVAPKHYLELFFPATLLMQTNWAVTAAYEPKIDFENNNALTHPVRLQLAKRLEELPFSFSLSIKSLSVVTSSFRSILFLRIISRRSSRAFGLTYQCRVHGRGWARWR